jgi:hypothetical protein
MVRIDAGSRAFDSDGKLEVVDTDTVIVAFFGPPVAA